MGNATSADENSSFWENAVSHGPAWDPRFGNVNFYHDRSQPTRLYMHKNVWTDTSEEAAPLSQLMLSRQGIQQQNLASLVNFETGRDDQFMTSWYKNGLAWEYYDNNLENELIAKRSDSYSGDRGYPEKRIWYLVNSITNADIALRQGGMFYHGDIQPSTVMFDDANKVKMIDNRLVNPTKTLYERMLYDKRVKGALSPTLMEQLAQKKVVPRYDPSREDSWALGMTALCAATGNTLDDYYDWETPALKDMAIQSDLDNLSTVTYSQELRQFMRNCLAPSEMNRWPMEANADYLRGFQKDIENFQFDFKDLTPQIITERKEEKRVVRDVVKVEGLAFNSLVAPGDDSFFRAEAAPQPAASQVITDYIDFFNQPEIVSTEVKEISNVNVVQENLYENRFVEAPPSFF